MPAPAPRLVAAILAGGRASRLGGALKPLLPVGGARIIDRELAVLHPLVDELLLITNDAVPYDDLGLRVIPDLRPGLGPLAGLESALAATDAEVLFLVGGDMPALDARAIALVLDALAAAPDADVAAVLVGGEPEPLHTAWRRRLLPRATARLDAGKLALKGLLDELTIAPVDESRIREFDPELLALANINTPEDLEAFNRLLAKRG
jgi:molybdopterin-guanine dinucleotide biosynthesis protein A